MKTAELKYRAIDWAVAKCEGYEIVRMRGNEITFLDRTDDGALNERQIGYSTDWAQGGPIIERESIFLVREKAGHMGRRLWAATLGANKAVGIGEESIKLYRDAFVYGPTPLISAMRCYVASKLGDEVDIPTELTDRTGLTEEK